MKTVKDCKWPVIAIAAALAGGCASESQPDGRPLAVHPQPVPRVVILPICFSGSARTDQTLTLVDLKSLNHQAGSNLTSSVVEAIAAKGFEVVPLGRPLCGDEDWDDLDADVHRLLEDALLEFRDVIARQQEQNRPGPMTWPFPGPGPSGKSAPQYKIVLQVADLATKLGSRERDLIVLWETTACFESSAVRKERNRWNYTWGAVLTPLAVAAAAGGMAGVDVPIHGSPSVLHHAVAVVDVHTQQVIEWHTRFFPGHDARDTNALRASVKDLLADLRRLKSLQRK